MKTIFTAIIACMLIFNSYAQNTGQWQILNEGRTINWFDFVTDDIGWTWGREGFFKTKDGGESWEELPPVNPIIYRFDFLNERIGYAIYTNSGFDEYGIIKTLDGGVTWSAPLLYADRIRELDVVDENCVYAVGSNVWKTSDGGETWHEISPDSTKKGGHIVSFVNTEVGLIAKGFPTSSIFRTFDGGFNWDEYIFPDSLYIFNLKFINDSTAYMVSHNHSREYYFIYMTTDSGSTWQMRLQTTHNIYSLTPIDGWTIFITTQDSASVNLMKSTDGGQNWVKVPFVQCAIHHVLFTSKNRGYIHYGWGSGGFLIRTTDGGETWQCTVLTYPIRGLSFQNNRDGIAFGGYSIPHDSWYEDIFITSDGGDTWKQIFTIGIGFTEHPGLYQSSYFLDNNIGFLAAGNIFRTTDGGYTWNEVNVNEDDSTFFEGGQDIYFKNDLEGWAVGGYHNDETDSSGAALLGTSDGGLHWNIIWKEYSEEYWYVLHSINFINTTGWAVGDEGLMLKYTEQNQWQLHPSVTDLPLNDVFFCDEKHGWIAGGYVEWDLVSIFLKTVDGGESWDQIRFDKYLFNDMYFADSLHGWAVGRDTIENGMILETFDGGENWNPVVEKLSAPLNAIDFKDGYGWAVGENGLVLRTDNGSTWINQNTGQKYPSNYRLFQNFPNPFNPVTNIVYQIPNSDHVELSIYDVLGKKVATLVNKKQAAGIYDFEWDAKGFASGIYIYRIKTNEGFIKSRKLVLLK